MNRTILAAIILAGAAMQVGAATIPEVLASIERNNPELKSTAAANAAEVAELRGENTLPPTSIEYSPFFKEGISGVASSELVVSQEFDFPTLYATRSRQASMQGTALDKALLARRTEILSEARTALLDLILLDKEREILSARRTDTSALLEARQRSLELGKSTILEVNRIRLELQDLNRELLQNEAQRAGIADRLQALNANLPLDLDGIDYDIPADRLPVPLNAETLLLHDPSLAAAEAGAEAARHAVSVAKSGWLPSLTLGYRRNTEEKESANGFIVGAALPLFTNSAKKKAADARMNAAAMEVEATRAEQAAIYEALLKKLRLEGAVLATYDLSLMDETLSLYRKSLDAGLITITDYYTETTALYDRLLTRVRLESSIQQTYSLLTAPLL